MVGRINTFIINVHYQNIAFSFWTQNSLIEYSLQPLYFILININCVIQQFIDNINKKLNK
jgi:hypothetical protein